MKIDKIKVSNYGHYSSDNYGAHTLCFTNPLGTFWFSYDTLVAFVINGEFHICKNTWGTTTGKHINWIDRDKRIREDRAEFEANYIRCTKAAMAKGEV